MKKQNGITLISLIITIIVMLILAGVALSAAFGDNSMISQAIKASEETSEKSQIEEQAIKKASDFVYQKTNLSDPNLSHSGTVPEGAYYANLNTGTFYDTMPETVSDGDIYLYGDYLYIYNTSSNGWYVHLATDDYNITTYIPDYPVKNRNQTSYGQILESVNNVLVTNLSHTFKNCTSLITSPKIPSSITGLMGAYSGCTSLTTAPILPPNTGDLDCTFMDCTSLTDLSNMVIPSSVFCVNSTFKGCTNLTAAPIIPASNQLYEFYSVFEDCTSLTGNVTINSNPTNVSYAFNGTIKPITITGSCSNETKANLASTSSNGNVNY